MQLPTVNPVSGEPEELISKHLYQNNLHSVTQYDSSEYKDKGFSVNSGCVCSSCMGAEYNFICAASLLSPLEFAVMAPRQPLADFIIECFSCMLQLSIFSIGKPFFARHGWPAK